jgi:hypothetical protein
MSTEVFDHPPSVELLQVLARGSLRQNLPKAVRLWVILRSLYGDEADEVRLKLGEQFTYEEWRDQFFTQTQKVNQQDKTYHKRDEIPILHDPECRCAKTLSEWLFNSSLSLQQDEWCQSFQRLYPIHPDDLKSLLASGKIPQKKVNNKETKKSKKHSASELEKILYKPLPEYRLLGVTGKNLEYDFSTLVEMGWLQQQTNEKGEPHRHRFCKVSKAPNSAILSQTNKPIESEHFTHPDLAILNENLSQKINGIQRFFIHVEYIVNEKLSERVKELQARLKKIWENDLVPLVKLTYCSAKLHQDVVDCVVYPVCIYYYQRAPYLFAYGQNPLYQSQGKGSEIDWYDYRLDRIQDLKELKWVDVEDLSDLQPKRKLKKVQEELGELKWIDVEIPCQFLEKCQGKEPPSCNEIKNKMSEALGFDFYKPKELLLLRFDRYFHGNYIEGTERAELFKKVSFEQVKKMILSAPIPQEDCQCLLSRINSQPSDVYCKVNYRVGDNNVIMRLRAWGAKVEVLLPMDLRKQIAEDVQKMWNLYK